MIGGHHQFNGHEFEEAQEMVKIREALICCSPWGHKYSDMTERLNTSSSGFIVSILL